MMLFASARIGADAASGREISATPIREDPPQGTTDGRCGGVRRALKLCTGRVADCRVDGTYRTRRGGGFHPPHEVSIRPGRTGESHRGPRYDREIHDLTIRDQHR